MKHMKGLRRVKIDDRIKGWRLELQTHRANTRLTDEADAIIRDLRALIE